MREDATGRISYASQMTTVRRPAGTAIKVR
jgi:hypothetical protein